MDSWTSPPFELTEREGAWYGRGTADDKGEIVSRLAALRMVRDDHGDLPFGVTFVVEGEEEIGSPNLATYVHTHAERLRADGCLWEAGGVDAAGRATTYCGMKGVITVELRARTAGRDLHSSYGAVADDAAYRLAAAVATLRDIDGRVLIDGFHDGTVPPTPRDLELVDAPPDQDDALREEFGVERWLGGLSGRDWRRSLYFEPTLNVNGFHAGYGGDGAKTVLPADAVAKLDMRFVPDQDPQRLMDALRRHLHGHGFDDVEVVQLEHAERAVRADVDDPFVAHAIGAMRDAYGAEPVVLPNSAGSGPMHPFVVGLGVPVVAIGCGYPGSRIHAPDEHVRIADFANGTRAALRLFERVASVSG